MTEREIADLRLFALQQASFALGDEAKNIDLLYRRAEQNFAFLMRGEPRTDLDAT